MPHGDCPRHTLGSQTDPEYVVTQRIESHVTRPTILDSLTATGENAGVSGLEGGLLLLPILLYLSKDFAVLVDVPTRLNVEGELSYAFYVLNKFF